MDAPEEKSFLGKGWAFPVSANGSGDVRMALYEEDIRQSILIILGTNPGERLMLPEFGAGLRALIFEPLNTTTMALARHRVENALISWEPRIDLQDVQVTIDPEQRNRINIEVHYAVRSTNTFYNLVYPYYLIEGDRQ